MERVDCGHGDQENGKGNTAADVHQACCTGQRQSANEVEAERNLQDIEEPTSQQEQETPSPPHKLLIRYLYMGHFLARWGARFSSKFHTFLRF